MTTKLKAPPPHLGYPPLTIRLQPVLDLTDDRLLELSSLNRDLRLERTPQGGLIVMPPAGGETGERNSVLQDKMREYLDNGAGLGWLLDPEFRRAYLYRPEGVEELDNPEALESGPVLSGFMLDLHELGYLQ